MLCEKGTCPLGKGGRTKQESRGSERNTRTVTDGDMAVTPVCLVKTLIHAYGVPYERRQQVNPLINPVEWRGLVQSSGPARTNNSL